MFKLAILLIGLSAAAHANLTVQRCAGGGTLPTRVVITGCSSPPCNLVAGNIVNVQVTFTAPGTIRNMWAQVIGHRNNRPVSYDIGAAGMPCNHLIGNQCPINGGQSVVYAPRLLVNQNIVQGVTFPVEMTVRDQTATPVMCFRVNVRVNPRAVAAGAGPEELGVQIPEDAA